ATADLHRGGADRNGEGKVVAPAGLAHVPEVARRTCIERGRNDVPRLSTGRIPMAAENAKIRFVLRCLRVGGIPFEANIAITEEHVLPAPLQSPQLPFDLLHDTRFEDLAPDEVARQLTRLHAREGFLRPA